MTAHEHLHTYLLAPGAVLDPDGLTACEERCVRCGATGPVHRAVRTCGTCGTSTVNWQASRTGRAGLSYVCGVMPDGAPTHLGPVPDIEPVLCDGCGKPLGSAFTMRGVWMGQVYLAYWFHATTACRRSVSRKIARLEAAQAPRRPKGAPS